ncbi:unnamed protein product, partial [marine sediment metagenome]
TISLQKEASDHIEVGAPPLKTKQGWLVIYCYIKNYLSSAPTFGIEAVLLDLKNPLKIIKRTTRPLLVPEKDYELYGEVPNVIFPSGAFIQDKQLNIYYGAADTTCCLAKAALGELIKEMTEGKKAKLERYKKNPIIRPRTEHPWESEAVFNPAAVYEGGKVHFVYRSFSPDKTSFLGYASSKNGFHITERLAEPIYVPREDFEKKAASGVWSGCEDPRITKIKDRFYMCYTAFDGEKNTRVALTSIKVVDFLSKRWRWAKPIVISDPNKNDKNACVMSEKIKGKYVFFHRVDDCIRIDFIDDLNFKNNRWLDGKVIVSPRPDKWDSSKIGIAGPPIKTKKGWLLIYHGLSKYDNKYRLGAILLDKASPDKVLSKLDYPIIEPETDYENTGVRPGTIFS